jgi:hypothetical protein
VLINWNGGVVAPFTQDLPEQGTVFRISSSVGFPGEEFSFVAAPVSQNAITSGPEGMSIYLKYKMINKASRIFHDFYISFWSDPDVGWASDDFVGCDPENNVGFAYQGDPVDEQYGYATPAFGFKLLEGPIVPSAGDTATVDGAPVPGYRNLNMHSFTKYINSTDPDNYRESYCYMTGYDQSCNPFIDPTTGLETSFMHSGDPVAGTGWLDESPSDRRMMATYGPFDFRPWDTQQIVIKLAFGQGTDRLSSITTLREILDYNPIPTGVEPPGDPGLLPREYSLSQNYPNPFNPSTTIKYALPERAHVTIEVFNTLGQKVAVLVNEAMTAGEHSAVWNGTDRSGDRVASGVYLYRLRAGDFVTSRKMLLLK